MQKINSDLNGLSRIETGSLQINEDWPGIFIRGDNAFGMVMNIKQSLEFLKKEILSEKEKELIILNLINLEYLFEKSQIK